MFSADEGGQRIGKSLSCKARPFLKKQTMKVTKKWFCLSIFAIRMSVITVNPTYILENYIFQIMDYKEAKVHL